MRRGRGWRSDNPDYVPNSHAGRHRIEVWLLSHKDTRVKRLIVTSNLVNARRMQEQGDLECGFVEDGKEYSACVMVDEKRNEIHLGEHFGWEVPPAEDAE